MRKSLAQFVKEHKVQIDAYITETLGRKIALSSSDRKEWVMNDETLYKWALSEGVNV